MNHLLNLRWAALAAFFLTSAAFAQGGAPSSQDGARRTTTPACCCGAQADGARHTSAEPGPYAKYLIHLGHSKEQAMEAARSIDAGQAAADVSVSNRKAP